MLFVIVFAILFFYAIFYDIVFFCYTVSYMMLFLVAFNCSLLLVCDFVVKIGLCLVDTVSKAFLMGCPPEPGNILAK